jgi:hypothetical protein
MSLLSQSCAEATRLLSESQEACLPLPASLGLRLHLILCRQCRRYRRHLALMRSVFESYPENLPATTRLPNDFRQSIVQKLRESR